MYELKKLKGFNILNPYVLMISLGLVFSIYLTFVFTIIFLVIFFKLINEKDIPKDKWLLLAEAIGLIILCGNPISAVTLYIFVLLLINLDTIYTRDTSFLGIIEFLEKLVRFIKVTLNRFILALILVPNIIFLLKPYNLIINFNSLFNIFCSSLMIVYGILLFADLMTFGLRLSEERYLNVEKFFKKIKN